MVQTGEYVHLKTSFFLHKEEIEALPLCLSLLAGVLWLLRSGDDSSANVGVAVAVVTVVGPSGGGCEIPVVVFIGGLLMLRRG